MLNRIAYLRSAKELRVNQILDLAQAYIIWKWQVARVRRCIATGGGGGGCLGGFNNRQYFMKSSVNLQFVHKTLNLSAKYQ